MSEQRLKAGNESKAMKARRENINLKNYFSVFYVHGCLQVRPCTTCVPGVVEARGGHHIPRNCSSTQVWTTTCVLGIQLGSSGRAPSHQSLNRVFTITHRNIMLSHEKKHSTDAYCNMDEAWKYTQWKGRSPYGLMSHDYVNTVGLGWSWLEHCGMWRMGVSANSLGVSF